LERGNGHLKKKLQSEKKVSHFGMMLDQQGSSGVSKSSKKPEQSKNKVSVKRKLNKGNIAGKAEKTGQTGGIKQKKEAGGKDASLTRIFV